MFSFTYDICLPVVCLKYKFEIQYELNQNNINSSVGKGM